MKRTQRIYTTNSDDDSHRLYHLAYISWAQILERFAPIMTEQADEMVRQVGVAAAGGNEFDIFERITRAALVRRLPQSPSTPSMTACSLRWRRSLSCFVLLPIGHHLRGTQRHCAK